MLMFIFIESYLKLDNKFNQMRHFNISNKRINLRIIYDGVKKLFPNIFYCYPIIE